MYNFLRFRVFLSMAKIKLLRLVLLLKIKNEWYILRKQLNFVHSCHTNGAEASRQCIYPVAFRNANPTELWQRRPAQWRRLRWQNPLARKDEYLIWESASCECERSVRATKYVSQRTNIISSSSFWWGSRNYRQDAILLPRVEPGKESFSFLGGRLPLFADKTR